MALVGKERVLARIDRALAYIEARMAAEQAPASA
jgi:glutamyl-tRNA synthetase